MSARAPAPSQSGKAAPHAAGVPVIDVNDNFGHWHSERGSIVVHGEREGRPGRALVAALRPRDRDDFVVKPQSSGFYATNLPVLLPQLGVTRLILTGVAADICVLFTAADAHMRDYDLWVPGDTVASESDGHRRWAPEIMRHGLCAEMCPTTELALADGLSRYG